MGYFKLPFVWDRWTSADNLEQFITEYYGPKIAAKAVVKVDRLMFSMYGEIHVYHVLLPYPHSSHMDPLATVWGCTDETYERAEKGTPYWDERNCDADFEEGPE